MALKDLVRPAPPTPADQRPPGITCEKYTRGEDGKRCIHFQQGGTCALPDEFVCTEWQKHNGPNKRSLPVVSPAPVVEKAPAPKPVARDLFGNPLPEVATPPPAPKVSTSAPIGLAPKPDAAAPTIDVDQLRGFTTEDIESFKALGVEVLLHSETYGDVWLVPAYTGRERKEITPEHAATLARVMSVFPGSHIVSFEKTAKTNNPERRERPVEERS
jgi:hypothetical protein